MINYFDRLWLSRSPALPLGSVVGGRWSVVGGRSPLEAWEWAGQHDIDVRAVLEDHLRPGADERGDLCGREALAQRGEHRRRQQQIAQVIGLDIEDARRGPRRAADERAREHGQDAQEDQAEASFHSQKPEARSQKPEVSLNF
jgi:hypothetical protein